MKLHVKFAGLLSISALALSLSGCGPAGVDHAAAACDSYDSVVVAVNGSDADAVVSANAALAATLAVWQTEGGDSEELYGKLAGYAGALEGFILSGAGEEAQTYLDYVDAETNNIDALCSAARG